MKTVHDFIAPIISQWYGNCILYINCVDYISEREKAEKYYLRMKMCEIAIKMIMKGEY